MEDHLFIKIRDIRVPSHAIRAMQRTSASAKNYHASGAPMLRQDASCG